MNNEFDLNESGDFNAAPTFTLYGEDGTPQEYLLLARTVHKNNLYYALSALTDPESYAIVSVKEDGEDIVFEAIEDDLLFDELVVIFDELLSEELDYDKD